MSIEIDAKFQPRHAKYVIPAAGVLAGYLGGFIGAHLVFWVWQSAWVAAPVIWLCFCLAGLAAMIPVDKALGEAAAHADLLKVPVFWSVAALMLVSAHFVLAQAGVVVPTFVDNLVLWGAGVLAIWLDEPDSSFAAWLRRVASK